MNQWKLLRKILGALGLSAEKIDDLIATIQGWLTEDVAENTPQKQVEPLPYKLRDDFLSAAELSFYRVLQQAIGDKTLLTKVSLGDLFYASIADKSKWRIYRNKIDRKHVDFLLCDPQTLRPLLGIELDDKNHKRRDRQQRDLFVNRVFAAAKLPILHIRAAYSYNTADLQTQIATALGATQAAPISAEPTPTTAQPAKMLCPKCSAEMRLRTATRGANKGNKFWGCSNYPKCKGIVAYRE